MAQTSITVGDLGAAAFRSALNNALLTLVSQNSGASAPSTTYANMMWYDSSNNLLKMRNEADSAWITLGTVDQSNGEFIPSLNGVAHAVGRIFYSDGTRFVGLAAGANDKVLKIVSGLPAWADEEGGATELVTSETFTATSTKDITIPTGYTDFVIHLSGIVGNTAKTNIQIQFSADSGTSFVSVRSDDSGLTTTHKIGQTQNIYPTNGRVELFRPGGTTYPFAGYARTVGYANYSFNNTPMVFENGFGNETTAKSDINLVRLKAATGTIAGEYRLFGYRE